MSKKVSRKHRQVPGPVGEAAEMQHHSTMDRIEFILVDEDLEIQLPINVPLSEPLSFQVEGEFTRDQLEEIAKKVSTADVGVTDAYYGFLDFISNYDLGPKFGRYFDELADFLELASWFDTGIHVWLEEWSEILDKDLIPDDEDRLDMVLTILNEHSDTLRASTRTLEKIEDSSTKAAISSREYVNQQEACHILHISDTELRPYCNNLDHKEDLKGLNGVQDGKHWRFARDEVHRFGQMYWASKRKKSDAKSP